MFRSGHHCTSTSSARGPCYFGLQAYFTIRILRKVREHTVPTWTRFHVCSRLHWRFMRDELEVSALLCIRSRRSSSEVLSSTKFSLNSCSQLGNSCDKSLCTFSDSLFIFWFSVSVESCNGSPQALHSYFHFLLVLDFRCICWHQIRNPVMKMMVVRYVAINSLAISEEMWFLTADPVVCIPMVVTEFPERKKLREASPIAWHTPWLLLFFAPRRWPSPPSSDSSMSSWSPKLSRVKVSLTDHMHTRSKINYKLSFLRLFC